MMMMMIRRMLLQDLESQSTRRRTNRTTTRTTMTMTCWILCFWMMVMMMVGPTMVVVEATATTAATAAAEATLTVDNVDPATTTMETGTCTNPDSCNGDDGADAVEPDSMDDNDKLEESNANKAELEEEEEERDLEVDLDKDDYDDDDEDEDYDEEDEDDYDYYDEEDEDEEDEQYGIDFGVVQVIDGNDDEIAATMAKLLETENYMEELATTVDRFIYLRKECRNEEDLCSFWATLGECESNPDYMTDHCAPACQQCTKPTEGLGIDFGVAQALEGDASVDDLIKAKVKETEIYMLDTIWKEDFYTPVRNTCFNHENNCTLWAVLDECNEEDHVEYMQENCSPACGTCHKLHYDTRCAADPNDPHAWAPGDLNRMFERMVHDITHNNITHNNNNKKNNDTKTTQGQEEEQESVNNNSTDDGSSNQTTTRKPMEVTVLSRPSYIPGDDATTATYKIGPWVIYIDHFISEEEAKQLIYLGYEEGYEVSQGVGDVDEETGEFEDIVADSRTSTNAWCDEKCINDPLVQNVLTRMEQMTGIPTENSESLQLLKCTYINTYIVCVCVCFNHVVLNGYDMGPGLEFGLSELFWEMVDCSG